MDTSNYRPRRAPQPATLPRIDIDRAALSAALAAVATARTLGRDGRSPETMTVAEVIGALRSLHSLVGGLDVAVSILLRTDRGEM